MSLKITTRHIDAFTQAQSDLLDEQLYDDACAALRTNPNDADAQTVVEKYKRRGLVVNRVPRSKENVGVWKKFQDAYRIYICGQDEGDVVPVRTLSQGTTYHTLGTKVASCTYISAGVDTLRTAEWVAQDRKRKGRL